MSNEATRLACIKPTVAPEVSGRILVQHMFPHTCANTSGSNRVARTICLDTTTKKNLWLVETKLMLAYRAKTRTIITQVDAICKLLMKPLDTNNNTHDARHRAYKD